MEPLVLIFCEISTDFHAIEGRGKQTVISSLPSFSLLCFCPPNSLVVTFSLPSLKHILSPRNTKARAFLFKFYFVLWYFVIFLYFHIRICVILYHRNLAYLSFEVNIKERILIIHSWLLTVNHLSCEIITGLYL